MVDKEKEMAAEAEELKEEAKAEDANADAAEETAEKSEEEKAAEAEAAESERYMRLMAEFQNFKKRAAKEKTDIHAYANEKIVNELLPVLDNFERALASSPSDDPQAYAKGMSLIFEQMTSALDKNGVKEIAALGETFDPNLHNAVMMEDSEEYESGKISKVLQKGYTLNEKVVRPAMVAVSK